MDILPKKFKEFSEKEYWDKFFRELKDNEGQEGMLYFINLINTL